MSALVDAVRAEARKAATQPVLWATGAAAVAGAVAVTLLVRRSFADAPAAELVGVALGLVQAGPVAAGAVLGAAEYRGGLHGTSMLAVPRRGLLLVARWAVGVAVLAAVAGLVVAAVAAAAGVPVGESGGLGPQVLWVAASAWAAMLVADAARSALAGTSAVLAVLWIAPAALRAGLPEWVRLLPDRVGAVMLDGTWPDAPWVALAWLGACAAVGAAAAWREA